MTPTLFKFKKRPTLYQSCPKFQITTCKPGISARAGELLKALKADTGIGEVSKKPEVAFSSGDILES